MSQWIQVRFPDGRSTSLPLRVGMTPAQIIAEARHHIDYEGPLGRFLKGGINIPNLAIAIAGLKDGDEITLES